MNRFALTFVAAAAAMASATAVHAAIVQGDVAIVRFQSTNPDAFSFVALSPLTAGDTLLFTDNGWLAAGSFSTTEGTLTYTVPAGGVAAGTVVSTANPYGTPFTAPGANFSFNASGDQLFALTGTLASPNLLFGLTTNRNTWDADRTSASTSALPPALASANVALGAAAAANADAVYSGPTTGTKESLLAAISNGANWTKGTFNATTNPLTAPASFNITSGGTSSASLTDTDTPTLGTITVNGSDAAGYALAQATNLSSVTSGILGITGGITTTASPVLVYLDLADANATFPSLTGVTVISGSFNFGTGITYDRLLTFPSSNNTTGDFYFSFSGLPAINNIAVVPEPAALGLLAPAGLLLARRRRA